MFNLMPNIQNVSSVTFDIYKFVRKLQEAGFG